MLYAKWMLRFLFLQEFTALGSLFIADSFQVMLPKSIIVVLSDICLSMPVFHTSSPKWEESHVLRRKFNVKQAPVKILHFI